MRHGFLKVAATTPNIRVADCPYNALQINNCLERAALAGVKALVLPELCITGYTCGDLFLQDTLVSAAEEALLTVLAHSAAMDMLIALGVPLWFAGKLYDCAALLHKGKILGIVPKAYPLNHSGLSELRWFASGIDAGSGIIDIGGYAAPFGMRQLFRCNNMPGFLLGVEIGADLFAPQPPSIGLCMEGATLILNLSADQELAGSEEYRRLIVKSHSARLCCAYAISNTGQGESTTDFVFAGHNILAEKGAILLEKLPFAPESMAITEIDYKRLLHERKRHTFPGYTGSYAVQEFTLQMQETKLTRTVSPTPFVPEEKSVENARYESLLQIQAHGLTKRLQHTGSKTAVIGVSGGLDSTLALLICVQAMELLNRPMKDISALTMPCFGTTAQTRTNAERLCDALSIPCETVDITKAVQQHFLDIQQPEGVYDAAYENAQARERTQVLMDKANQKGGLVVGTGDLSELALGWATYNGDHMSMYAVNASIPKTLVRRLVQYAADTSENEKLFVVLKDILDTPVSPELLPATMQGTIAQETEKLVGPYELHDFFLYYFIRWGASPEKILFLAKHAFLGKYDEATINNWLQVFIKRFFSQQFKRSCMPDGPKAGSVSLSPRGDWSMPSDASVAIWRSWE